MNSGYSQRWFGTLIAPDRIAFVTIGPESLTNAHATAAQRQNGLRRYRSSLSLPCDARTERLGRSRSLFHEPDPGAPASRRRGDEGTGWMWRLSMNRASQIRMTNDEIRKNDEIRTTKPAASTTRASRHSSFGFLSSFVIRYSSFNDPGSWSRCTVARPRGLSMNRSGYGVPPSGGWNHLDRLKPGLQAIKGCLVAMHSKYERGLSMNLRVLPASCRQRNLHCRRDVGSTLFAALSDLMEVSWSQCAGAFHAHS